MRQIAPKNLHRDAGPGAAVSTENVSGETLRSIPAWPVLGKQVISAIDELNSIGNANRAVTEYDSVFCLLEDSVRGLKEISVTSTEQFQPLIKLIDSLSHHYAPATYRILQGNFARTHALRWKEFRCLLEDELALLSGECCVHGGDEKRRELSHGIIRQIRYDQNDIGQPWKFPVTEASLRNDFYSARSRSFFRQLDSHARLLLAADPIKDIRISDPMLERLRDNLLNGAIQFAAYYRTEPVVTALCHLSAAAYHVTEWLRPECRELKAHCAQLMASYLSVVRSHFEREPIKIDRFGDRFREVSDAIGALHPEFSEHLPYKGVPFDLARYNERVDPIKVLIREMEEEIRSGYSPVGTVEIEGIRSCPERFGALLSELAFLESSRVGGRNGLRVAYGKEPLREILCGDRVQFFARYNKGELVGAAILELEPNNLSPSLHPLRDQAIRERGNVAYAYLHLIVTDESPIAQGANGLDAYQDLMSAVDDCAYRHELGYIVGWCRTDNASLLKHLADGGELLQGKLTVEEGGHVMDGAPLLRLVHPRGLQRIVKPGKYQARTMFRQVSHE